MAEPKRLTLFDCVAIGVNGIIGSGIFFMPTQVASGAKSLSPLAFVACGALCVLVALCYAEVSGMFERSGGTYLYAREAFGDEIGFGVGWLVLVSCVLGYATIASYFGVDVAGALGLPSWAGRALAAGLVLALGLANWRGVKTGAYTSDVLTVVKVGALVLFVLGGLFFIRRDHLVSLGTPDWAGFGEGMVAALFPLSGFEFVAVVAGAAENPRRAIPVSIVGSLLGAVVLYSLIQFVIIGVLPSVASAQEPVLEAASVFGDGPGGTAVRIAMVISMVGFCSSSALVGPQLVASLASDGVIPHVISRVHPKRGTPNLAIALVTLSTMAAVAVLGTRELANLTIVTLFAQYVPTCLSVVVFRRWRPEAPRRFRVPLGATLPLVALVVMAALVTRIERQALVVTGVIMAVGAVVVLLTRALDRRAAETPKDQAAG